MMYELPKSLEVCGIDYEIRSDFRAVLDICTALSDVELTDQEKAIVTLSILYPDFESMPIEHYEEALKRCFWFINCGGDEDQSRKAPKLMDWEQDFQYIVAPVNRVIGTEIRALDYLHWWSFISAYYEIGDCTFAMIVRIRDKKARGKPLDKQESEWYRQNRQRVDLKQTFSQAEKDVLKAWGV
jgi:hypothetical protein